MFQLLNNDDTRKRDAGQQAKSDRLATRPTTETTIATYERPNPSADHDVLEEGVRRRHHSPPGSQTPRDRSRAGEISLKYGGVHDSTTVGQLPSTTSLHGSPAALHLAPANFTLLHSPTLPKLFKLSKISDPPELIDGFVE